MRSGSYIFYNLLLKRLIKLYLRADRRSTFGKFRLKIRKGIFHPRFFFSSGYMYEFISKLNLEGKRFLEIGCGSGILSLLAYDKGADVTTVDIDPKAVENTEENFLINFKPGERFRVLQSDVFSSVERATFDFIIVNPPYYFKKADVSEQLAWYCGENGEYFEKLFSQLGKYISRSSQVYMILEENCEIGRIRSLAKNHRFSMTIVDEKKIKWERNFIFSIRPQNDETI